MIYATGMTDQQAVKSGKSCFYSKAHGLWFADGETPPPLPEPFNAILDNPADEPDPAIGESGQETASTEAPFKAITKPKGSKS
jgi:hypothetical protein